MTRDASLRWSSRSAGTGSPIQTPSSPAWQLSSPPDGQHCSPGSHSGALWSPVGSWLHGYTQNHTNVSIKRGSNLAYCLCWMCVQNHMPGMHVNVTPHGGCICNMLNQAHDLLYTSTQGSNTIAYTYTVYMHYIQVLLVNFTLMWYRMVPYLALYMHNYA